MAGTVSAKQLESITRAWTWLNEVCEHITRAYHTWKGAGTVSEIDFEWREQLAPNNWSQTFFFCLFFFLVRDVGSALAEVWIHTCKVDTSDMISWANLWATYTTTGNEFNDFFFFWFFSFCWNGRNSWFVWLTTQLKGREQLQQVQIPYNPTHISHMKPG